MQAGRGSEWCLSSHTHLFRFIIPVGRQPVSQKEHKLAAKFAHATFSCRLVVALSGAFSLTLVLVGPSSSRQADSQSKRAETGSKVCACDFSCRLAVAACGAFLLGCCPSILRIGKHPVNSTMQNMEEKFAHVTCFRRQAVAQNTFCLVVVRPGSPLSGKKPASKGAPKPRNGSPEQSR